MMKLSATPLQIPMQPMATAMINIVPILAARTCKVRSQERLKLPIV